MLPENFICKYYESSWYKWNFQDTTVTTKRLEENTLDIIHDIKNENTHKMLTGRQLQVTKHVLNAYFQNRLLIA